MTTQPTNNPVPSESPRDLKFNAGKIDEFVTSLALKYQDRFGGEHYTIEGLRWLAQQAIAEFGWIPVGTFQAGATLTLPNQILKDTTDGEYYRWDGTIPKIVNVGSTPDTTGGIGFGAWISVGDASLRSMLASSIGAKNIGTSSGESVQDELNSLSKKYIFEMPSYFKSAYHEVISGQDYPQGLAESDNYWFIIYTNRSSSPQKSHIKRISKLTGQSSDSGYINYGDLHNVAVITDDEVLYVTPVSAGAYSYSASLTRYDFSENTTTTVAFEAGTQMSTTYGFCYDGDDKIYQLDLVGQAANPDGRFDHVRVYSISQMKQIGIVPMPREIVREGFVQALDYHNGFLYYYTGGAYLGIETSNKRVTSIYCSSLNGQLISGANYRADSFASAFQPLITTNVGYEAQGISCRKGRISLLCLTGSIQANILTGSKGRDDGYMLVMQYINSSSYRRVFTYSSFGDLNISNSSLAAGDAIGLLCNRMLDNSILECALDATNWSSITSQLGISAGNMRNYKANSNRITGVVSVSSSDGNPYNYVFSVYSGVTSSILRLSCSRSKSKVLYTGAIVATVGDSVSFDTSTYSSIKLLVTNSTSTNACAIGEYNSGLIKYLIDTNQSIALSNVNATLGFRLTTSGLQVISVSGNPIIKAILAE